MDGHAFRRLIEADINTIFGVEAGPILNQYIALDLNTLPKKDYINVWVHRDRIEIVHRLLELGYLVF